jgi:AcrR family transcriptional regulator
MTINTPDIPRRPRDATATRTAILEAARLRFTRDGFDRVGVRDIAADAGINAALVIRYFGSKENLFTEAITEAFNLDALLDVEREVFGETLARYIFSKRETAGALDPLIALLRSATNEQAGAILRRSIEKQFILPLAQWLGGKDAELRASLIAAVIMGLTVTRDVIGSEPLASSDTEPLVALIAPTLQAYVDGFPELVQASRSSQRANRTPSESKKPRSKRSS